MTCKTIARAEQILLETKIMAHQLILRREVVPACVGRSEETAAPLSPVTTRLAGLAVKPNSICCSLTKVTSDKPHYNSLRTDSMTYILNNCQNLESALGIRARKEFFACNTYTS